ncbi:LacI family DNA-binding transcriptional regulator [Longitalea luteola]|uniref:LacI family DNA-binding transcriptional regulator n=1 Tax=Longitalea luteola TaxID=2812563 RepID=UPI001A9730AF|nr:LacI family DNA-binding transcriptional regulator [Longitalea luteola]
MDQVNLKKLAKELNLAVSTVSRALRDSHEISPQTKERVRELALKLGFQPNPHASSLRQNKSKTIAVIIPEIENNFFSQVINGIESVTPSKGYHVLIYLTHEDYNKERDILQLLRNGRVDGIMISVSNTTTNTDHIDAWRQSGMPLVLFDRTCEELDVPNIMTNDAEMAFKATEHLLKRGCRQIAFLGMAGNLSISNRRKAGYLSALEKYKVAAPPQIIELTTKDYINRDLLHEVFRRESRPDGVFAAIEKFAVNTYEVCKELKLPIPREVKVVSFSNLQAAALFDPALSTIIQPAYDIGREAANILFKIIEKKMLMPYEKKMILPSQLIERASTAINS